MTFLKRYWDLMLLGLGCAFILGCFIWIGTKGV